MTSKRSVTGYLFLLLLAGAVVISCEPKITNKDKLIKEVTDKLREASVDGDKITIKEQDGVKEVIIDKDKDTVNLKGENVDVKMSESGIPLPESLPKDVPVYANSIVISSVTSKDGNSLVLSTVDPMKDVYTYYTKAVVDKGWTVLNKVETADGYVLTCTKGSATLNVAIGQSGDSTTVSVLY